MPDKEESMLHLTAKHGKTFPVEELKFTIGHNTMIQKTVIIDISANIEIGNYVEIQDFVMIFTHKHHWRHSRGLRKDIEKIEGVPLKIGNDVFIGVHAIIIGVREIADGAVIGAGCVLTKDVKPYEIWVGNPARCIGERLDA